MEHQNKLETVSLSVSGGPTPKATSTGMRTATKSLRSTTHTAKRMAKNLYGMKVFS